MGGSGSGAGYRWKGRRTAVEESLAAAVRDIRGQLHHGAAGTLRWTRSDGTRFLAGYVIIRTGDTPIVLLHYQRDTGGRVHTPVRLQTTPTQFGGERWWFVCPMGAGGVACNRRAGKLYLPPGARHFGCRHCHGLTYQSRRTARRNRRPPGGIKHISKILRKKLRTAASENPKPNSKPKGRNSRRSK